MLTDEQVLNRIAEEICRQARCGAERLDVDAMLAKSVWGRRQTERHFRDHFLTSPARYFRDCQTEIAGELLSQGDDVLTASTKSGFASTGRLHDAVVIRYGMTPGEMRRRGEGVHIELGFFQTQIGVVLVGATTRGMCWLALCGGEPDREMMTARLGDLRETYPNASFDEVPEHVQRYADQLVAYLDARSPEAFRPPLDILQGTTFQREVWAELQKTQPGETLSYSELARRIGRPNAVRAVASACGKNNLAIAIPCHRAVHKDGTLAGYRWGVAWKERLLQIEAQLRAQNEEAVSG